MRYCLATHRISENEIMDLHRVVVGVDFSPASIVAAKWAAHHVVESAELILVHSAFAPQAPRFLRGRYPSLELLLEVARDGADKKLRELAKLLPCKKVWIEARVGSPAEQIAAVARDSHADLIVVGTHGERRGLWTRVGSTAERLITRSPVPVLLATAVRDVRPRRILVALDDADVTPAVLRWAQFLGARFDARVTAVHVISSAILGHVLSVEAATSSDQIFDQARVSEEFGEQSDEWMESLLETGLDRSRVSSEVLFGEAGQEIIAAAERLESELIVMGSRGAGSVGRRVLGSVAAEVLRGAPCPVLVIIENEADLESAPVRSPAAETAGVRIVAR